jgi:hypothetical protein
MGPHLRGRRIKKPVPVATNVEVRLAALEAQVQELRAILLEIGQAASETAVEKEADHG